MTAMKEKLKAEIDGIGDKKLLKVIENIIHDYHPEDVYELSENEKHVIENSREQIMKGEIFTNDEIKEMSQKWVR